MERELKEKEELNTVYFEGNPLQLRQPALYRNKVRLALPQVRQIDASKFNDTVFPNFLTAPFVAILLTGRQRLSNCLRAREWGLACDPLGVSACFRHSKVLHGVPPGRIGDQASSSQAYGAPSIVFASLSTISVDPDTSLVSLSQVARCNPAAQCPMPRAKKGSRTNRCHHRLPIIYI